MTRTITATSIQASELGPWVHGLVGQLIYNHLVADERGPYSLQERLIEAAAA